MEPRRRYRLIMVVAASQAIDATAAAIRAYQGDASLRPSTGPLSVEFQPPVSFLTPGIAWETLPDTRIFDPAMVEVTTRHQYERLRQGIGSKPSIGLRQWPGIVMQNLRRFGIFAPLGTGWQAPVWYPDTLWVVVIDIQAKT